MGYKVRVEGHFSAAHNLRGYKGKCEKLHGHNWKVEAVVGRDGLDKSGMVIDFRLLKDALNNILERLDHKYLNRLAYFRRYNPTSENIAKYIYDSLKQKTTQLVAVTVWESENCAATYSTYAVE
jgi:6-pyruvoyltetrahydropterin/6-carboxytetrahydropterin synthase